MRASVTHRLLSWHIRCRLNGTYALPHPSRISFNVFPDRGLSTCVMNSGGVNRGLPDDHSSRLSACSSKYSGSVVTRRPAGRIPGVPWAGCRFPSAAGQTSRASDRPWINNGYAGVAEIPLVSRDNGKISTNGHSGQHSVRQVIIERFTPPAFLFHYPGTHARVGDSPIEEPPFKEVLKNAFEPFGKIRAAATGV